MTKRRLLLTGIFSLPGYIRAMIAFIMVTLIYSCNNEGQEDHSTFGLIQTSILNTSCAIGGCHLSKSDPSFLQHGLVLEKSVAYANLINVIPKNLNAQKDGLLLVKPFASDMSLLFHKIHSNSDEHHMQDYGLPMPLGLELLTQGQVEFIRRWIEAGAPEEGYVVDDISLLDDKTLQPENFEPLAPPAAGIQINIDKFQVAPNFEREFFVYKKLGNSEDIYVNRVQIKMRQNSHHFLLYDFNNDITSKPALDVVRDIRNPNGSMNYQHMQPMLYHVYMVGSQTAMMDYQFPPGVALRFPGGAALDFNSHYVNKQEIPIEGEVNVNLHTIPAASVQKQARTLDLGNTNFSLPPKEKTTIVKTYTMSTKMHIFALTSHTHQLGEKFVIKISGGSRHGEIVFTNTDWHHPPLVNYANPIILNPGEGLTSEITYNNTRSSTVYFGLTSEDEMGIIFGYYYQE